MTDLIQNRVEESGLISLDLAQYLPQHPIAEFDLSRFLWEGLVLKEKLFRESLKALSGASFHKQHIAVFCSAEAVIPDWAWMLTTSTLVGFGAQVWLGTPIEVRSQIFHANIQNIDPESFRDGRVVIKGCSDAGGAKALGEIIQKLQPVTRSIMYGEPCSTVPIYKRPSA